MSKRVLQAVNRKKYNKWKKWNTREREYLSHVESGVLTNGPQVKIKASMRFTSDHLIKLFCLRHFYRAFLTPRPFWLGLKKTNYWNVLTFKTFSTNMRHGWSSLILTSHPGPEGEVGHGHRSRSGSGGVRSALGPRGVCWTYCLVRFLKHQLYINMTL